MIIRHSHGHRQRPPVPSGRHRCLRSSFRFCPRTPEVGPDLFLQGHSDQLASSPPRTFLVLTPKIPDPGKPLSPRQTRLDGHTFKEPPWEVEWLQSEQKGYAKPYHAPAGRAMPRAKERSGWLARMWAAPQKAIVWSCRESQLCSGGLRQAGDRAGVGG